MKNKKTKKTPFTLTSQVPNLFTIMGLCAGLSSIRFALDLKWEMAIYLILLAALLDGMDGRLARMMEATSKLGEQLDSLADFISFGVAPAFVVFWWNIRFIEVPGLGWGLVLLFTTCMAIRLARFNSELDDDNGPDWQKKFFKGVPAPAGGLLILAPLMVNIFLAKEYSIAALPMPIYVTGIYMACVSLLLISRIPTFSGKQTIIQKEYIPLILVGSVICIAGLIIKIWLVLPIMAALYLCTIPLSIAYHQRLSTQKK